MSIIKKYLLIGWAIFFALGCQSVLAATLSVSPASGNYQVGNTFNVSIILDTQAVNSHGVDIHYLNYNPALLEIQDAATTTGIQISAGSLFFNTQVNSVNASLGQIDFSQLTTDSEVYNGSGTLATITFRVLAAGTASLTFNYSQIATTDCNVASNGQDILSSVTNGNYTLTSASGGGGGGGGWADYDPPANVSNLTGTASTTQIELSWQNPIDADFEGVIIIKKTSGYPQNKDDGELVYQGKINSCADTGLSETTDYYYKIFSYDEVPNYSSGAGIKITTGQIKAALGDGALIKGSGQKVYLIEDGKKRWIVNYYSFILRKLLWPQVITILDQELANYPDGPRLAALIRAEQDSKVYVIEDNGFKKHIPSAEAFNSYGYQWQDIIVVKPQDLSQYPRVKHIKLENDDKIYYLTETGLKRHVLSPEVFLSYQNKWNEIFTISETEFAFYLINNLIKLQNDNKTYLIENNIKRWIKTAEAFNSHGYDWSKIAPVNQAEFDAFQTADAIE